jgi:hypothetical protein
MPRDRKRVLLVTESKSAFVENAVRATEISITPKTEIAIAISVPTVTTSPRNRSPNKAACAGSVR